MSWISASAALGRRSAQAATHTRSGLGSLPVTDINQPPTIGEKDMRTRALVVIAGVIAVAALMNWVWNLALPNTVSGMRGHPDNSIGTLVDIEMPILRDRHGFDAYLHDVARGGEINVPTYRVVYPLMVENLSQVTIVEASYEVETTAEAVESLGSGYEIIGEGKVARTGPVVPYRFVMLDRSVAPSVTYYTVGSEVVVVDDRLGRP